MHRLILKDPLFHVDPWRLLDQTLDGWRVAPRRRARERYPIEVRTSEDAAVVTAVLPGVYPASLAISVQGETRRIRETPPAPADEEEGTAAEAPALPRGSVDQTNSLPYPVEIDQVTATAREGVRTVSLPKKKQESRQIPVLAE